MSSRKWLKGLKTLSDQTPTPGAVQRVIDEMIAEQNDRRSALVTGALVEEVLRQAVVSRFVAADAIELFKRDTPLSSFYNLTAMGYAMGLFDRDIRNDLDRVREIRNAFAHCRFPISFDTAEIADACIGFDTGSFTVQQIPNSMREPKRKYLTASFRLIATLRKVRRRPKPETPKPITYKDEAQNC